MKSISLTEARDRYGRGTSMSFWRKHLNELPVIRLGRRIFLDEETLVARLKNGQLLRPAPGEHQAGSRRGNPEGHARGKGRAQAPGRTE